MKDKRQRMAMAWPYAVYTDPAFAASILQAAAASAGGLPIAALASAAYPYAQLPPYYQPHPALSRYAPYPLPPRPHANFQDNIESNAYTQNPQQFCSSPTHSENSITTLSPNRPTNSPENCDGSSSCRCGIINCVAGSATSTSSNLYQPQTTNSATAISLLMTAAESNPNATTQIVDPPKKLFQPYKTDISEKV